VTWKTFRYASPFVAGAIGSASRTAVNLGVVAGLGYGVGARAATTAARWGPKAGLGQAAANQLGRDEEPSHSNQSAQTAQDNLATDATGGVPSYRRSENDPGYY